ncbi:MAG: 2-isopropylmalate synthase [Eubacteriales bacterium]|nr:2-isopropylmalate synthase [Eubacteriales bacterium]
MLELSSKTNLLEENAYKYSLQDIKDPNLFRDVYNYEEVPKVGFNHTRVPMSMPENIWITDTTFRDGQQSINPYTVDQIVELFKLMSKLGGPYGIIRMSEFFVYSERDREAVARCQDLGLRFPEITTWIRATREDFKLVKDLGIRETGILVSCSDYHIFKKLKMTRKEAMEMYLATVRDAFDAGVMPRCHLEDITRADFYGFVVPFVNELMKLSEDAGIPVRIRACDTMGYGVPYSEVSLPRSVPGIIYGLQHYSGVSSDMLEWHGHNDFYKAVSNAVTAWLFGASGVNCTLLGIGERTGNVPLEAMVFEYASLRGSLDGMDPTVITEIADYYKNEIGYSIPPMTPFVGRNFNVTRAGIHADGLLKDEEIYNIFDTEKILNRPAMVAINKNSGLAGIAYWMNQNYMLKGDAMVDKRDPVVMKLKEWVDAEYEGGRTAMLSTDEIEGKIEEFSNGFYGRRNS